MLTCIPKNNILKPEKNISSLKKKQQKKQWNKTKKKQKKDLAQTKYIRALFSMIYLQC